MDFRILGPLEVVRDGQPLELGGRRQRAVLVLLLLARGEVVSTDRLIEELWAGRPPATATNTLQAYVSRLRKLLGDDGLLVSRPPGYMLTVRGDTFDLDRFTALAAQARKKLDDDPQHASELLSQALAMWRGPPLFDFLYEPFAQAEIARLEELRLDALELRVDADLALGRQASIVPELEGLVALHPFREGLRGRLMLALYRSGRQADALEAYRNARTTLVDELGLDPSPSLQRLEQAILEHDPQLDLSARAPAEREPAPRSREVASPPPRVAHAQRKTVTVVSIEISASSSIDDSIDPETLGGIEGRCFELVRAVVEGHGGDVDRSGAASLLAVFGAAALHEDDPLRAVRAADEIRARVEALGVELKRDVAISLETRIGIDTGEALVGGDGGDRLVVGEPVKIAVQLQQLASSRDTLMSEATYRLLRSSMVGVETEGLELSGGRVPLHAWRVTGVALSIGARALDLSSPLVARERELGLLCQTFERVRSERTCHLVTVIGPAGIGKSRLVHEFGKSRLVHELVLELGEQVRVLRGRCLPYGAGITFWPAAEIVRQAAGLVEADDPGLAIQKLAEILGGPDSAEVAERIAGLVGLAPIPVHAADSFWSFRRLLQALTQDGPLVVILDDIHWAEPTMLDLIEHVLDWSLDSPLLLLCMARHELFETRPGWGGGKLNASSLALEPLTDAESGHLVENLLGDAQVASEASGRIVEIAGGNPLFVEEVLRTLIDDELLEREDDRWMVSGDLQAAAVPPSINAVLAARLDRLSPGERTVAECAAVIGAEFDVPLVVALCGDGIAIGPELTALVRRDLIRPSAAANGSTFHFRHILIRDVAYGSMPKRLRAELHERLVEHLELHPEELQTDREEILGYHLEQVCRYRGDDASAASASELAERATRYLAAAGRRALERGDDAAAAGLLSRAWDLHHLDRAAHVELLPVLGTALVELGRLEQADAAFAQAIEIAHAAGRPDVRWRAAAERSVWQATADQSSRSDRTLRETERAIAELEKLGDDQGLAEVWRLLSDVHNTQGRQRQRADALTHALEHARRAGDLREEARSRHWLGSAMLHGPTPVPEVMARAQEDLTWSQEMGDRSLEAYMLCILGSAEALAADFDVSTEHLARGRAICEELGLAMRFVVTTQLAGFAALRAADPVAAERDLRAGFAGCEAIGERSYLSTTSALLAHALVEQGKHGEGLGFAAIAEETAAADDFASLILARTARGRALLHTGDHEQAELLVLEAVTLADQTDFIVMQADAYAILAEALAMTGRRDEAASAIKQACRRFDAKGVALAARPAAVR